MNTHVVTKNNDRPWWIQVVYVVGVPSAIAMFLVFQLSTTLQQRIDALHNAVLAHMRQTTEQQIILYDHTRLLRSMCVNLALANKRSATECFRLEPVDDPK